MKKKNAFIRSIIRVVIGYTYTRSRSAHVIFYPHGIHLQRADMYTYYYIETIFMVKRSILYEPNNIGRHSVVIIIIYL